MRQAERVTMQPRMLYGSDEVHKSLKEMFGGKSAGRRVVISAYLGSNAPAYLPNPKGITLVCAPQPGSTRVAAVESFRRSGANVLFAKDLHMKVYWSEGRGCLLTSANLSDRALGSGPLKEAGVIVDDRLVDIDRLLRTANGREVQDQDLLKLHKKELEYDAATVRLSSGEHDPPKSYLDWYAEHVGAGEQFLSWRLGWWTEGGAVAVAAKAKAEEEYSRSTVSNWINVAKGQVSPGHRMLMYSAKNDKIGRLSWMFVDAVVPVTQNEVGYHPSYRFQAVQINPSRNYKKGPFDINEQFARAFRSSAVALGEVSPRNIRPSSELLKRIARQLEAES